MAFRALKILRNCGLSYLQTSRIMTSAFNLKKVEEELNKNPYFEKYQEKIAQLRKQNPDEYVARLKAKEDQQNTNSDKDKQVKYPDPKSGGNAIQKCTKKSLSDILKLDMVENKTAEEIRTLWSEYHKGKDVIYSTFTSKQYEMLNDNYLKNPTFVFPLPRGDGYEFFLFQHSENELHFTPMVQYKKHGSNAPECLYVAYFTDLKGKNIILMRGEFDKDVVSPLDCQYLLNVAHMFYNGESEKLTQMIETFNNKPDEFKYPEIISEVERLGYSGNK